MRSRMIQAANSATENRGPLSQNGSARPTGDGRPRAGFKELRSAGTGLVGESSEFFHRKGNIRDARDASRE